MPLSQGSLLGEYEILAPLGAGGMGEVYRARDPRLNREVAIKVLPEFYSRDPERLRRFEQEARAAAALNHPNILVVYQLGTASGIVYIVSELLDGETLRERMRRGPMPLRSAVDVGVQIARGLAAAHKKGIIHRDLKPENLFLTRDGHTKILDFGLARVETPIEDRETLLPMHKTMPGVQMGTVGYMSPEQVRGAPADERSDIFSFCVVLREMLTGTPTFEKPTSVEVMTAILNEYPVSQLGPNIPLGVQRVLERGLEKNPEQRFQSASDLAFALESLSDGSLMGQTVGTGFQVIPGGAGRQRRSGRIMGIVAAALVTAALIALALYLLARGPAPPQATNYVQLTQDGLQKSLIGTDGARLYLSLTTSAVNNLGVLNIADRQESQIALPSPDMQPMNLSPDGAAFLVIQGRGFPFRGSLWSVPVLGGSPRRLGDAVGNAAAWSADRKLLAWADGGDLYIAQADGTSPRKIVSGSREIDSIAWSPDGTQLRLTESQGFGASIGAHSLWEVGADGAGLRQLLAGWHNPPDECCGTWTPDGRFFVFQSGGQIWSVAREGRLFHRQVVPAALTASPMTLSTPVVSRDATKLFVVGATYRGELMQYDSRTRQFTDFLGGISGEYVAFSKDGQWVAWVSYPDGVLWRSRVDGSDKLQLTAPPMHPAVPRWSPDGKNLAFFVFAQSATQPSRMYEIPAEGGSPTLLLPNGAGNQQDPNWSPDGTRIVFSGDQNEAAHDPKKASVHILDLATHRITDVPGSHGMFSPRWSPDGTFLLAMDADSRTLRRYSFATQKWTKVAEGNFGWLCISNDGKYVYSLDFTGDGRVVRVRLSDGQVEAVASLKGFVTTGQYGGSLSLTPNDEPLLLRDRGTQDVYALDFVER